ncbi:unnamed protein product, partial [Lampetra planeri]
MWTKTSSSTDMEETDARTEPVSPAELQDQFGRQVMKEASQKNCESIYSAPIRSTSQPGWTQRRLPSMDTEDFETIPSSPEESTNSSEEEEEEGNNHNVDTGRCRVQLTYQPGEGGG